jgi:hypothetical protein
MLTFFFFSSSFPRPLLSFFLSFFQTKQQNRTVEDVVVLSGDHLYRMDYLKFVEHHRATGADITIGALPVERDRASDFGLMKVDDSGRIVEFAEKPMGAALDAMRVDTTALGLDAAEAEKKPFMASMGCVRVFSSLSSLFGSPRAVRRKESQRVASSLLSHSLFFLSLSLYRLKTKIGSTSSRRTRSWTSSRRSTPTATTSAARLSPRPPRSAKWWVFFFF